MKDGLYKVSFCTNIGSGTGVIVITGNKIRGGDASMYYTGEIEVTGTTIYGKIRVKKHSVCPGISSVFGFDDITLTIKGDASTDTTATLDGIAAEATDKSFQAHITFLE